MNYDGLEKLLWVVSAFGAGNPKAHALIREFGSLDALYNAPIKEISKKHNLADKEMVLLEKGRNLSKSKEIIEGCLKNNIKILTAFDKAYPKKLRNISPCPLVLFYKGRLFDFDSELCITVVGTRNMTEEGANTTRDIASGLAKSGALVISGLARGIDTAAHKGAIEVKGKTAAVLGCGIDVIYPPENKELFYRISENGLLISEFLPGLPPYPHHFQIRNRLLSALSNGVLVAESGKRGGSLITVRWALEQGKDIFALPGDISSPQSEGTNALIKQGAKLVTSPMDILEEYLYTHKHKIKPVSEGFRKPSPVKRRPPVRRRDYADEAASPSVRYNTREDSKDAGFDEIVLNKEEQLVFLECKNNPVDSALISAKTGIPLPKTLLILTKLELSGLISQQPGGVYIRLIK